MKEKDLRSKTILGMLWTAVERFGALFMAFGSNLILARLLSPDDFGCIGMLHIFIAISGAFVYGGLGTALIQKSTPSHIDYSTVFIWNISVSTICYLILFISSPYIADFYGIPKLSLVLRVHGTLLFIVAFSVVQTAQVQKALRFKELSVRSLISSAIGLLVGIIMAYTGYGVWSLVFSSLLSNFVSMILIWRISTWRPTLEFSISSFKTLFGFGGMMLLTSLIDKTYINIQGLLIGKQCTASDLGYYTQAKKLEEVPNSALAHVVSYVSFPVFAKLQNDRTKLLSALRKNIKSITYLNFPLCVLLIIIAHPLVILLYGSKWEISVPYFQALCISGLLYTLNSLNSNIIMALGKGNMYFVIHIIQKSIGLSLMLWGIKYGVKGVLWAVVASQYINYIINSFANRKLIGYGIESQIKDVFNCLLLAIAVGGITYFIPSYLRISEFLIMLIQICTYILLYVSFSKLLKIEGYETYLQVIRMIRNK